MPRLILASSSPRRRELLDALGLDFEIRIADVDETPGTGESAADMVLRLAAAKAGAVGLEAGEVALGADTAVVLDGHIFGKPESETDGLRMLAALSGQTHEVMTGVAVCSESGVEQVLTSTKVQFREINPDEARRYWHSGEPHGKAGAYAIQGRGGVFVEAIMGSYSGVVGLPVFETAKLLRRAGIQVLPAEPT